MTEIIIVDNGSKDGSVENLKAQISKLKTFNTQFKLIINKKNYGYPRGNNQALKIARGKYILFLNSDTIIKRINFEDIIGYMDKHPGTGALTVKVNLSDGRIDPASHRGFPNIWNAFCYFFALEQLFKNIPQLNRIFGGYHLVHLNLNTVHEIDSPTGAFYLTRKQILNNIGGFDETFFMYGEDIDLSYRIKKSGYKIIYYPNYEVTHLKYASGLDKKNGQIKKKVRLHFFSAMEIFYKKHYSGFYPSLVNRGIYFAINLLKRLYV